MFSAVERKFMKFGYDYVNFQCKLSMKGLNDLWVNTTKDDGSADSTHNFLASLKTAATIIKTCML